MHTDIHSINHVGIAAPEMSAIASRYEAMGFTLTPYSAHKGAWKPGQPVVPLGSGNRCIMFPNNYLEILAGESAANPGPRMQGFLQHHQGAHIICFGSEDLPSVARRIEANHIETSGIIPLQRDVDTPEGMQTARFERIQFSTNESPEGYIQAAKHLTPDFIYQARYIEHANGCTELARVVLLVTDMPKYMQLYTAYTGQQPTLHENVASFYFPLCSTLQIMESQTALRHFPGTLHPPLPGIAAVSFRCPDIAAQHNRLTRANIPVTQFQGRLIVAAEHAGGVTIIFES